MYVVKRDGKQETVHFDKITARLKKISYGLSSDHCDPVLVAQKVCAGVYKGVTTSQLDELAAETAAAMTANHPDYASGLKTGMYYLRSRAAADAIKFTVDTTMLKVTEDREATEKEEEEEDNETKIAQMVCSLTNSEECLSCGS